MTVLSYEVKTNFAFIERNFNLTRRDQSARDLAIRSSRRHARRTGKLKRVG